MKKRITAIFIACIMVLGLIPVTAFAAGSFYISTDYISLAPGGSSGFTFGAENAVGGYTISKSGPISVSPLGDGFLDGDSVWIEIVAEGAGTGYVYIDVFDGADYDENDLTGWSRTITVEITDPDDGYSGGGETIIYEDETDDNSSGSGGGNSGGDSQGGGGNSGGNSGGNNEQNTEPQTTTKSVDLSVTIGNEKYSVMTHISDLNRPSGFEESTVTYNETEVPVFVCKDVIAYVLQNDSTGEADLFTYNETTKQFTRLPFIQNGEDTFVMLDYPKDFKLADGYKQAELKLEDCSAKAVQRTDKDFADFYYIYCIVNGEKSWYSYDSKEGTFQRFVKFENIIPEEEETTAEPQPEPTKGWAALNAATKALVIALIAAIIIIIGLLIALIAVLSKKNKNKPNGPTGTPPTDGPAAPVEESHAEAAAEQAPAEEAAAETPVSEPETAETVPEEEAAVPEAEVAISEVENVPAEAAAEAAAQGEEAIAEAVEEATGEISIEELL